MFCYLFGYCKLANHKNNNNNNREPRGRASNTVIPYMIWNIDSESPNWIRFNKTNHNNEQFEIRNNHKSPHSFLLITIMSVVSGYYYWIGYVLFV